MTEAKAPGAGTEKKNWGPIPKSPYDALGVNPRSTEKEIKAAYRKLSRRYHPDKNPGDAEAEAWFKAINEAYDVLTNPKNDSKTNHYFRGFSKSQARAEYKTGATPPPPHSSGHTNSPPPPPPPTGGPKTPPGNKPPQPEPKPEDPNEAKRRREQAKKEKEDTEREERNDKKEENKFTDDDFSKEIEAFFNDFGFTPASIPESFNRLNPGQKVRAIQDLKKRIVDIVQSDARTQYSESAKKQSFIQGIKNSFLKEGDTKNLEKEVLKKMRESAEGKKLILDNLTTLTEKVSKQEIGTKPDGKARIVYINVSTIENPTLEEAAAITNFNIKANEFAEVPYEWGQEAGGKNKKKYSKAETEYEQAREEILKIKTQREKPENKGRAMLEVLEMDNGIQMEQLLTTHPEFEKELQGLADDPSKAKNIFANAKDFLGKMVGKKTVNHILFAGGYATRYATTALLGAVAAPIAGGLIGGLRARYRAKDTLEERTKDARKGKTDESKEAQNTADAADLNERLKTMLEALAKATTPEEKAKRLDQIKRRIAYTQDKIEGGLVNFGDAKISTQNQFNLINNLNTALAQTVSSEEPTRKEIDARLTRFLAYKTANIDQAQKEFITKQMVKGAVIGATFAGLGYTVRWAGEHFGWWGNHAGEAAQAKGGQSQEDGFMARAEKWLRGNKSSEPTSAPEQHFPNGKGPGMAGQDPTKFSGNNAPVSGTGAGPTSAVQPGAGPSGQTIIPPGTNGPAAVVNNFSNEGIKFEGGKGGIAGILELKKQIAAQYNGDYSKAPQSVQDFMNTDATKEAIKLGFYDPSSPDESALIKAGDILKFDKDGNLLFGHPDANGNIPVLEKFHGKMFDSDGHIKDGHIKAPTADTTTTESTTGSDELGYDGEDSSQAEIAAALKKDGFTGDPTDREAVEAFYAKKNLGSVESGVETPDQAVETPTPEADAAEAIKKQLESQYENGFQEQGRAGFVQNPNSAPGFYNAYNSPSGSTISDWNAQHNSAGVNPYNNPEGRVGFFGRGFSIRQFDDLPRGTQEFLIGQKNFVINDPFGLSGKEMMDAFHVYNHNLHNIFPESTMQNWTAMKSMKINDVLKNPQLQSDPRYAQMFKHIMRLRYVTNNLKPSHGTFWRGETVEHYLARATQMAERIPGGIKSILYKQ